MLSNEREDKSFITKFFYKSGKKGKRRPTRLAGDRRVINPNRVTAPVSQSPFFIVHKPQLGHKGPGKAPSWWPRPAWVALGGAGGNCPPGPLLQAHLPEAVSLRPGLQARVPSSPPAPPSSLRSKRKRHLFALRSRASLSSWYLRLVTPALLPYSARCFCKPARCPALF